MPKWQCAEKDLARWTYTSGQIAGEKIHISSVSMPIFHLRRKLEILSRLNSLLGKTARKLSNLFSFKGRNKKTSFHSCSPQCYILDILATQRQNHHLWRWKKWPNTYLGGICCGHLFILFLKAVLWNRYESISVLFCEIYFAELLGKAPKIEKMTLIFDTFIRT